MKEKWIEFEYYPPKSGKKTSLWIVKSKSARCEIGLIKWHSAWRKYAFFPLPVVVLEEDCLRDIAEVIEEATRKHKKDHAK